MYYEITMRIPQGDLIFKREVENSSQIFEKIDKIINNISKNFNITKEEIEVWKVIRVSAPYSTL